MAIGRGQGNPPWTMEEVVLALELYLECEGSQPATDDPRVAALSDELRRLPMHSGGVRNERFRNNASVAFKLLNLRRVDTGRGLRNASRMDRVVWQMFSGARDLVAEAALRVRTMARSPDLVELLRDPQTAELEVPEGRLASALHRWHERSKKPRAHLVALRRSAGQLRCEACGCQPMLQLPQCDDAGFEVHHLLPFASSGRRVTRVKDLALLCATCHRVLHRLMVLEMRWLGLEEFRKAIGSQAEA